MIYATLLFCSIYCILAITASIGFFMQLRKESVLQFHHTSIGNQISLIIPFRNEAHRIKPLLNSLLNSKSLPNEVVFVNDCSDDNSVEIIQNYLGDKISYKIVDSLYYGKKGAIKTGIELAHSKYILSMDADVIFTPNYFNYIHKLAPAKLLILPINVQATGFWQVIELDFDILQFTNLVVNGYKRPILSSGANLLFEKSAYEQYSSFELHQHILSGDDQFLLADFIQNKQEIVLSSAPELRINTFSNQSLKTFVNQRLRWFSKTPKVKDQLANFIGFFNLLIHLIFWGILIYFLSQHKFRLAGTIFCFKAILDTVTMFPFFVRAQKSQSTLLLPIYELIKPLLFVIFIFTYLFYNPSWKNRKL